MRWFILGLLVAGAFVCPVWVHRSRVLPASPRDSSGSEQVEALSLRQPPKYPGIAEFRQVASVPDQEDEDVWEDRWRRTISEPRTVARDEDLVALIEEWAGVDPSRAMAVAQGESDIELRADLLQAAVRGWGGADPEAAAAWAKSQSIFDPGQAMAAVFHGVSRTPETALRLNAELCAQDPEGMRDYGAYLIAALSRIGEFTEAAAFAANGKADVRMDWLNAVYSSWADDQPQAAMKHVAELDDPSARQTALDAVMSHWANNDPRAAAEYALSLPGNRDRSLALSVALQAWAVHDPTEATAWMMGFEPSPELDPGAATVATQPDVIRQPQVAVSWAESIVDPRLRVRTLATIVSEWAASDRVAARNYAETSPNIRPEERSGVMAAIAPDSTPNTSLP